MSYDLAFCIGVSNPGGGLPPLPGAVHGATAFSAWATRRGYRSILVTDADLDGTPTTPISVDVLHGALQPVLNEERKIDRLVVYFAGHGFAHGMEDFWLLSGFRKNASAAINLLALRHQLSLYQPEQIALIGDACSEYSKAFISLTGCGVVDLPEIDQRRNVEVETIKAASLGDATFMEANKDPALARCLFSEILLSALHGQEEEAIETRGNERVVSSRQLRRFLEDAVASEGGRLQLSMRPRIESGFQFPNDIYFKIAPEVAGGIDLSNEHHFSARRGRPVTPRRPEQREYQVQFSEADLPDPVAAKQARLSGEAERTAAIGNVADQLKAQLGHDPGSGPGAIVTLSGATVTGVASTGRGPVRVTLSDDGSHLLVKAPEFPLDVFAPWRQIYGRGNPLRGRIRGFPYSLGLQLEAGPTVFVTGDTSMSLAILANEQGGVAAMLNDPKHAGYGAYNDTANAIASLLAGELGAADIPAVAERLRYGKHRDPMRGVAAAYLYARIGDIDSVRQIAWYYADARQLIPFDIALLAGLKGRRTYGGFLVSIPEVAERPQRRDRPRAPRWLYEATPESRGVVGGLFPILRQGWSLLKTSGLELHPELAELALGLTPAPITTLDGAAAARLSQLIRQGDL